MKIKIVFVLLVVSLLISCSKNNEFNEVKTEKMTLSKNIIIGFGTGKSRSPQIAVAKAESNAKMNLITQVSGMEFLYSNSNGSIVFNTKVNGVLKDVKKENSYNLGDNINLSVLSSAAELSDVEINKALFFETSFRTENLEKSLIEKHKDAIKQIIEEKHSNITSARGKIYLTDLNVSDFEEKKDYAVDIKILIVISETN